MEVSQEDQRKRWEGSLLGTDTQQSLFKQENVSLATTFWYLWHFLIFIQYRMI